MNHHVKNLYALGQAKWYEPFVDYIWNPIFAQPAETHFNRFIQKYCTSDSQILELGCGSGRNLNTLLTQEVPFKSYLGLDFSPDMLKIAKQHAGRDPRIDFKVADLESTAFTFGEQKFDLIICTWVLSHLQNRIRLVNFSQELLDSGGKIFFCFVTRPGGYLSWLLPLFKVYQVDYVRHSEICLFENVREIKALNHHLMTLIEIHK